MPNHSRPIIIGAGAAGLIAAMVAARRGRRPLLLEKNPSPGRKLATTGNGRGNYTNVEVAVQRFHSATPGAIPQMIAGCDGDWAMDIFRQLGIEPNIEADGRVFPSSGSAKCLVDVLVREIKENGGTVKPDTRVTAVRVDRDGFKVTTEKSSYSCDHLLVTGGGKAHPQLGSSGEGLDWIKKLGHKVVPTYPVLVPLLISDGFQQPLQGVKVFAELKLICGKKTVFSSLGDVLFTHYGISGPAALNLSGHLVGLAAKEYSIILNLRPHENREQTALSLQERLHLHAKRTLANAFVGLLPRRLAVCMLRYLGLDPDALASGVTRAQREVLLSMLRRFPLAVSGTRPWKDAQVMGGGISLQDIDMHSFMSRKLAGLFVAGEVLDVWGDSGGFNLHFAWISGYRAGEHI